MPKISVLIGPSLKPAIARLDVSAGISYIKDVLSIPFWWRNVATSSTGMSANANGKTVGVLAIVQARVSSSRLPAKVLQPILGKPMLVRQLERLRRCKKVDKLIVATSDDSTDLPIVDLCATES